MQFSEKEISILRYVRRSRHKITAQEIARGLDLDPKDVEVFVRGLVGAKLLNVAPGTSLEEDSFYTNPERREEIFGLVG